MKRIPLSAVKAGSILARNIYSHHGTLLYPSGTNLTEKILDKLKFLGITNINVPADSEEYPQDLPVDDIDGEVAQIIDARFGLIKRDEFLNTLYDLATEREHRILLGKYTKSSGREAGSVPAFKTEKPQPVPMEKLLKANKSLGTLPVVFHRLIAIVNNPYASAQDAAKVIATDPALSIKLLRLVNSAFYGLKVKVNSIDRAVSIVGTGQLVMLAMGAVLITSFKGLPVGLVNMQSFWSHSLACGIAAKLIAQKHPIGDSNTYFIAGLLHDIGRLIYLNELPEHSFYMLTEARRRRVSLHTLEIECLGYTHEELNVALLESWQCPTVLIERIKTHHESLTPKDTLETYILPVANLLSQALGHGSSGEPSIQAVPTFVWKKLNINLESLKEIAAKLEEQVRSLRLLLTSEE